MHIIKGLKVFSEMDGLPETTKDQIATLESDMVRRVICFSLGPEGTNIAQASRLWLEAMCITRKSEVRLGDTPEACLQAARGVIKDGVVAVFVTCAVYADESRFFFINPDVFPFWSQHIMLLDEMQLAATPEFLRATEHGPMPGKIKVASHPSPQHLLQDIGCEIIIVSSNAAAAKHCRDGLSSACITTESARKIYGLETLHKFGSPRMVFFFGITGHSAGIIKRAFAGVNAMRAEAI